jgi:hypothetical protein
MRRFASVIHTVFNCGVGAPWGDNQKELRFFVSLEETSRVIEAEGLRATELRLRQDHDPTDNVLMGFVKP